MKGQFFIISSVVMVYVIIATFQYLSSFGDINLSRIGEMQEPGYIYKIRDAYSSAFNQSNLSSDGDYRMINPDMEAVGEFFSHELSKNGITFNGKFLMFSNGLESGDFGKWSGVAGTPEVSDAGYDGTYSMYCDNLEFANKTMPPVSEVYARAFVDFKTIPKNSRNYFIGFYDGGARMLSLGLNESDGNFKMAINFNPSGQYFFSSNMNSPGHVWHYYELYWLENGTNSRARAWYDGKLVIDATADSLGFGKSISGYGFGGVFGDIPDLYVDCAAVSGGYIGSECYMDSDNVFGFTLSTSSMRSETKFAFGE